jgi:ABC-2 type transport system ATP-binding protein
LSRTNASGTTKGNRQKIQLIAAFATRPELLILDEPTSGTRDPLMEAAFRETVGEARRGRCTVFSSSHILASEVEALATGSASFSRQAWSRRDLPELRHLSQHVVEATFSGNFP